MNAIRARACRHHLWLVAALALAHCGDDDEQPTSFAADGGSRDATQSLPVASPGRLPDGIVGSACSSASECGNGSCMQTIPVVNLAYPGGYCTGRCSRDADCGEHGVCVPGLLGSAGSCYLGCDETQGCARDGYRCRVVSNVGRCIAAPPPLGDHVVGNACTSDVDCGGAAMSCLSMLGSQVTPGGYCSQSCAINEDCGAGGVCINGINIVTINSGRCLQTCTEASDCRDGYDCSPLGGVSIQGGPAACTPAVAERDAGAN